MADNSMIAIIAYGTDELNRGHGLALHKCALAHRKFVVSPHFRLFLSRVLVCDFHFWSEKKLTCQYPMTKRKIHNLGQAILRLAG